LEAINVKCVILDYSVGEVRIIGVCDTLSSEDVESLLVDNYEYHLKDIHYMLVRDSDFSLKID